MPKQIKLTSTIFAWVDDEDFDRVSRYKWTLDTNGYVVRKETLPGKVKRKVLLHRFIMNAPHGFDVDHEDHDPLNNLKSNLRICTRSQNSMNRGPKPGSSSQYKGVSFHKRDKAWRACLTVSGQRIDLGYHYTEQEAAIAYDYAAYAYFGEFAYLNFPEIVKYPHGYSKPGLHLERVAS